MEGILYCVPGIQLQGKTQLCPRTYVCLKVWVSVILGSKVVIYKDNLSAVTVLNSGDCRNAFMQSDLREKCFLKTSLEFQVNDCI